MSTESTSPSLRGKTVAVFTRTRAECPAVLRECLLETRGGRLFLVGASVPAQRAVQEWTDGVRRAVAWDAVDEYFLFDSPEDYYAHAHAAAATASSMPTLEYPQSDAGNPVEPSGI